MRMEQRDIRRKYRRSKVRISNNIRLSVHCNGHIYVVLVMYVCHVRMYVMHVYLLSYTIFP